MSFNNLSSFVFKFTLLLCCGLITEYCLWSHTEKSRLLTLFTLVRFFCCIMLVRFVAACSKIFGVTIFLSKISSGRKDVSIFNISLYCYWQSRVASNMVFKKQNQRRNMLLGFLLLPLFPLGLQVFRWCSKNRPYHSTDHTVLSQLLWKCLYRLTQMSI